MNLIEIFVCDSFCRNLKFSPIFVVYGFHDAKENFTDAIYKASVVNQFNKNVATKMISKYFLFMLKYRLEVEKNKTKTTDVNTTKEDKDNY